MMYLDLALRGGAITTLLLLAAMLWQIPISRDGRLSVAAVAVTKSAFLVISAALPLDLPQVMLSNMQFLASLSPMAITWLILTIFLDAPGQRWPWMLAAAATSAALFAHLAYNSSYIYCVPLGALLNGALLGLAMWSSRDDLVECRCRARPGFAAAIAGVGLLLTLGQFTGVLEDGSITLALAQAAGVLLVALAFAIWLLRPDISLWPGETHPLPAPTTTCPDEEVDPVLTARVQSAMNAGIWREEGLTIGALANKLSVPEHRLRRAINQGLGHRNFSSFINRARIEAARSVLSDPTQMNTTILEIAYDVGFASVGPFNRAFRAETGHSPTEFRKIAQGGAFSDSEKSAPITAKLH
ncbi:MAG: helix-turn-helix domain-containing protein [Pseudomonadota bacterium]